MTSTDLLELDSSEPLKKGTVWLLLAVLLAWGLGLRIWYATPELGPTRYWDERYGLENLQPFLEQGSLRPVHGFHPGLSYLPHGLLLKASDLLHRATGRQAFAIFDARGHYTSTAYLICRTLQAILGTLSLYLVFLIGHRLGGARLGLLAAFLLAVVPWHLRQSVIFKADMVLLFTVVLTLYLSLRAVEWPSPRSFTIAGAAIGLALSSKFNAGPVAVPLTVGALLSPEQKRRALLLLTLAAAVSVLVFLLLQPYFLIDFDIYKKSMGSTSRVYERSGQKSGHSRLFLVRHAAESLLSASFHGPLVGTLALAGLAALTVLSIRHFRRSEAALPWIMTLSYPLAYTPLYALATPRPSPHNWLPLSPVAALGAAWMLLALWSLAAPRLPATQRRLWGTLGVAALTLPLGWSASGYTYRSTVPKTGDRVLELLTHRLRRPAGRLVVSEHDFQIAFHNRHRKGRLAVQQLDGLSAAPEAILNRADAEVFPASRLEDPELGPFYRARMERLPRRAIRVIEPRPFRAWGPTLVTLLHPLRPRPDSRAGEWVRSADDPRLFVARLPPVEGSHTLVSLEFSLPRRAAAVELRVGAKRFGLTSFRGPRRRDTLVTPRFEYAPEVALRMKNTAGPERVAFTMRRWRETR